MAEFTKKAIRDSFVKLLNERPLKQISVRDIVNDCGINRNTFYYHFKDIPDLVESIVRENTDRLILEHPNIKSVEECINSIVGIFLKNRKAVLHIYKSVNRDIFERYQWRVCEYAVTLYLDEIMEGRNISDKDRAIVITYMKCVSFGLVISWLDGGMQEDIEAFVHRMCELKLGDMEEMIERCRIKQTSLDK